MVLFTASRKLICPPKVLVIFGELLSNYIANNYNFTGITDDNKLDISNIIITDSYNVWLKNLINFNKKNHFLLNDEEVLDDDFPNNKWVELHPSPQQHLSWLQSNLSQELTDEQQNMIDTVVDCKTNDYIETIKTITSMQIANWDRSYRGL